MENDTNLGKPIPTGVITPTEILPAVQTAGDEVRADPALLELHASATHVPAETTANVLAEIMIAPIVFWASVSASYLRMFDIASRNASASYRAG